MLGTNRDYKTRNKIFMKLAKEKNLINLWVCSKCNRKNLYKFNDCPRCGTIRNKDDNQNQIH